MVSFLGYLLNHDMYDSYSQATWMAVNASRGDDARALCISDMVKPTRLRSIGEQTCLALYRDECNLLDAIIEC